MSTSSRDLSLAFMSRRISIGAARARPQPSRQTLASEHACYPTESSRRLESSRACPRLLVAPRVGCHGPHEPSSSGSRVDGVTLYTALAAPRSYAPGVAASPIAVADERVARRCLRPLGVVLRHTRISGVVRMAEIVTFNDKVRTPFIMARPVSTTAPTCSSNARDCTGETAHAPHVSTVLALVKMEHHAPTLPLHRLQTLSGVCGCRACR